MQRGFAKKRGNTWTAYWHTTDEYGHRRQRSKGGFATKALAQAFLNTTLASLQVGDYVDPARLTVREYLLDRWLPIAKSQVRPSTYDNYDRMVRLHVLPALGGLKLQLLSADHLDTFYAELLRSGRKGTFGSTVNPGLAPKTVRSIHTTLHKALKDAERKRLVVRNVASAADAPKLLPTAGNELRTWEPEQLRSFLEGINHHRLATAFLLAATTGMRRGEVLGLRWRDVDLVAARLTVRQTLSNINYELVFGSPKTARSRRSIALDEATVSALKAHRRRQLEEKRLLGSGYHDGDLVFAREDGHPFHPDHFSQLFERTVARLKLPRIRLHDLRHTHATLGLAAGISPKVMSDRLGHSTVAFTMDIYTHAIPRLEEDAAERISGLIFR